jgi:hypothetical protein
MRCEGEERLPREQGTIGILERRCGVHLTSPFLLAAVVVAAASGCGGGPPAQPTFTPKTTSSDDAGDLLPDGATPDEIAAAFAKCGTSPATGTIPADVNAILVSRCQPCHQMPPMNGAPFPLITYEDVHAPFVGTPTPIYEEMYMHIQPDGDPHMPFGNAPQLTADQLATLSRWLLSCAPSGN